MGNESQPSINVDFGDFVYDTIWSVLKTEQMIIFARKYRRYFFTMKSLILAQDER